MTRQLFLGLFIVLIALPGGCGKRAGDIVKINIRKSGAYVIMGKPVTQEMVEKTMKEAVAKKPEVKVLILADKEAKHLYVAKILSICKSSGVKETHIMVKTLE